MTYRDPTLSIASRVKDLLGRMNLDEKLAQCYSFWIFDLLDKDQQVSTQKVHNLIANGIGQLTRAGGASTFDPPATARTVNALQRYLVKETRLGIPAIVHEECCSGYMALGGTVFPQMLGLAGTFQPDLARQMTEVIRQQMRAVGAHQGLAPVLDVARDPRWGRVEETFGEDPLLVSQFGVAYVRGLQGEKLAEGGVMATGKHFIGHSLSQGGQNCAPVHIGWRELWDVYLAPFQAAIRDAGLHTVMNSYPEIDGEVVAASRTILTELLRERLGFEGMLVSDYAAISMIMDYHHAAPDRAAAAKLALQAGIQVELPSPVCYREPLKDALERGQVEMELLDAAVASHLQKKFELGLFEQPYVDEGCVLEVFDTADQRRLASEIARRSLVLLTNDGLLPFKKTITRLAVIGPNADDRRCLQGDYSYASMLEYMASVAEPGTALSQPDANFIAAHSVRIPSLLEAIREAAPTARVDYARGCEVMGGDRSGFAAAVQAAQAAEAVVLVLGDRSGLMPECSTGETRDSADLRLSGVQNELAEAILATGKPVAVVLINGRPLAIPELADQASAILEAWLPGEEGGPAIAAALFGEVNPGGKLPITFPRHAGQVPIYYNQKPSGGRSNWYVDYVSVAAGPLFPFGHGLSYTSFDYFDFSISARQARPGQRVDVRVSVTNTGQLPGEEVVQLYVKDEVASLPRPVKELKGFIRLALQPGECRTIVFHLPVNLLAFYDRDQHLMVESGTIRVMLGSSSQDIRCQGEFEITGASSMPVVERLFNCPVEVE